MTIDVYRYPYIKTSGPNGSAARPSADGWLELAVLDGWLYLAGEGDPPSLDGVVPAPAELSPAIVAASARHQFLLGLLAARRYRAETAGITWNGWPVATDRASQAALGNARQAVAAGLRADGATWKFADGVHQPLTNAQILELAAAVFGHVQACFDREAELAAVIRASPVPNEYLINNWGQNDG